jgi:C1A family cysteine protease
MRRAALNAGHYGIFALLLGACAVQATQPAAAPAPPPPQAFTHPGFVYYNAGQPIPAPPRMPPAVSRPVAMNTAHLQAAAAQPSRCNIPKEVAPGVFVHMDCFPYRRVAVATVHATALKINVMQRGAVRWLPARTVQMRRTDNFSLNPMDPFAESDPDPNDPQFIFAANTAAPATPALPDLVDHRLNGTEGPIKDQGDVGACTAFGLSSVMDNSLRRAGLNITTSPEHVWAHYATPTMEDAASGNLNKSVTTFDAFPYSGKEACEIDTDTTDDCGQTYGVLPNTAKADAPLEQKISAANNAGGHRITSFQELAISPPNIDEVVSTLASGADIWAGFNIDSSVWVNRQMQNFVIPDWTTPDGGHAVAIAGYRKVNGGYQFLIHNSWGVSWGDQGYAWISQAMVSKWMHLGYKVTTDTDPGAPGSSTAPLTDEDCPGDQVLDSVTNKCTPVCTDASRPANGMCPNGPPPAPQSLQLPAIPGFNGIPGIPAIPGFSGISIPGFTPTPAPAANGQQQQAAPKQGAQPFTIPTAWPWPVPTTIPNFLPAPAPQK